MKINLSIVAILAAFALSTAVQAKDEGFYAGGSVGLATIQQSGFDFDQGIFDIDDEDFAYKLFGGYQFSPLFALEGGYRDLGSGSFRSVKTELSGFDVFGVAGVPLGPIRVFGKAGAIYWDSTTRARGRTNLGDDGFNLGAGAGLEIEIGSLGLRGEVEYFDVLSDVWMYSVGVTLTF